MIFWPKWVSVLLLLAIGHSQHLHTLYIFTLNSCSRMAKGSLRKAVILSRQIIATKLHTIVKIFFSEINRYESQKVFAPSSQSLHFSLLSHKRVELEHCGFSVIPWTSLMQGCRVVSTATAQTLSFPEKDGCGVFNLSFYSSCIGRFSCGLVS